MSMELFDDNRLKVISYFIKCPYNMYEECPFIKYKKKCPHLKDKWELVKSMSDTEISNVISIHKMCKFNNDGV